MSNSNIGGRFWKEIAMDMLAERYRPHFQNLAEELHDALLARELEIRHQPAPNNSHYSRASNPSIAYEKIVDDAVALMRSDYASLQMLFPERGRSGELRLLAFRGFNPEAAKFWEWVNADSKCTCGVALRIAQRVVAPDIATCDFLGDSEDRATYLQSGIRACQTTPLFGHAGSVVGMISTHWRLPHQPSEEDFYQFDILARQAADLIESSMLKA